MGVREWMRPGSGEARSVAEGMRLAEAGDAAAALARARAGTFAEQRSLRAAVAAGVLPASILAGGALPRARADADVFLEACAEVRAGGDPAVARARLDAHDARVLRTAFGVRTPSRALGVAPLAARLEVFLPDLRCPRAEARAALRAALAADPGEPRVWLRLAALRHPDDAAPLAEARTRAGRRADHTLLDAVAIHGGPGAFAALRDALNARDIDPGRGFAQRRVAADGLGRLGYAAAGPVLRRALRDERVDFEGRPGAGLGVQYPVRANLLWALGELGDPAAAPDLLAMLGDTGGSAFGGFYLPAMDALVRLGAAVIPAVERVAGGPDEVAAANALGVLHALGQPLDRWRHRSDSYARAVLEAR